MFTEKGVFSQTLLGFPRFLVIDSCWPQVSAQSSMLEARRPHSSQKALETLILKTSRSLAKTHFA